MSKHKIKNYKPSEYKYIDTDNLYGGSYKSNIKRKNLASKYDLLFLNLIASDKNVKEIIYFNDYTEKKNKYNGNGYLQSLEQIQNTLNTLGADAIVQTHDSIYVDFKVLKYYEKYEKKNKIYNGKLNDIYGMDNLVIQYANTMNNKHNKHKLGWGNNRNKITEYILVYVPETKFLYVLNYNKLIVFIEESIMYDDYIKLRFDKKRKINGYNESYYEKCISIPIEDLIERNVICRYLKVNDEVINNSFDNKQDYDVIIDF